MNPEHIVAGALIMAGLALSLSIALSIWFFMFGRRKPEHCAKFKK